jgi:hypothetical protein
MVFFYSAVGSHCLWKINPPPDADDGNGNALLTIRCVFDALSRAFHILAGSVNGVAGGHDEDREKCEESGDEYLFFNFVHIVVCGAVDGELFAIVTVDIMRRAGRLIWGLSLPGFFRCAKKDVILSGAQALRSAVEESRG